MPPLHYGAFADEQWNVRRPARRAGLQGCNLMTCPAQAAMREYSRLLEPVEGRAAGLLRARLAALMDRPQQMVAELRCASMRPPHDRWKSRADRGIVRLYPELMRRKTVVDELSALRETMLGAQRLRILAEAERS